MLYRLFISDFTDRLAYASAIVAALWRLVYVLYPAAVPDMLLGIVPLYFIAFAALAGGLLIAKYVLMEGFSQSFTIVQNEKERLYNSVQELKRTVTEVGKEKDAIEERERLLKSRLARLVERENDDSSTALRKKIRTHEEDKKTALTFLLRELQEHLSGTERIHDREIVRLVSVLRKEITLLDNEVKRGEKSFYELILKIADIRENIFELVMLNASSHKKQEEKAGPGGFPWMEADPSRKERIFKFLKVAFHPDRFSSAALKEEASRHFQWTMESYHSVKERVKTTQ